MKTRVSPAVVGAFVVGAFTLGILALLFFGGVSFFHQQQRFVVFFDEPIQGLDLGSPVKLRGVAVGRVVALNVRYDQSKNHALVAVVCEFERNMITDGKGKMVDLGNASELQILIDSGLRAQLGVIGLATGLLFVELDFLDPKEFPKDIPALSAKYPVVPAELSAISEFQASATEILTKLKRVDFEGLSNDLKGLLVDARTQVDNLDLKGLGAQWQRTGASIEALAKSPEIKRTFAGVEAALQDLRSTLATVRHSLRGIDDQVGANGKEVQTALLRVEQTLKQFEASAATVQRFIDSQQNLGEDTHVALTRLTAAADAVERLADYIERNPSALISGRAR